MQAQHDGAVVRLVSSSSFRDWSAIAAPARFVVYSCVLLEQRKATRGRGSPRGGAYVTAGAPAPRLVRSATAGAGRSCGCSFARGQSATGKRRSVTHTHAAVGGPDRGRSVRAVRLESGKLTARTWWVSRHRPAPCVPPRHAARRGPWCAGGGNEGVGKRERGGLVGGQWSRAEPVKDAIAGHGQATGSGRLVSMPPLFTFLIPAVLRLIRPCRPSWLWKWLELRTWRPQQFYLPISNLAMFIEHVLVATVV